MLKLVDKATHIFVGQRQEARSREFFRDPAEGDAKRNQEPEIEKGSIEDRESGLSGEISGAKTQQADGEDKVDAGGQAEDLAHGNGIDSAQDGSQADTRRDQDSEHKQPGLFYSSPGTFEDCRDRHGAGESQAFQLDNLFPQRNDHHDTQDGAGGDSQRQGQVVDLVLQVHQEEDRDGEDDPRIDGVDR